MAFVFRSEAIAIDPVVVIDTFATISASVLARLAPLYPPEMGVIHHQFITDGSVLILNVYLLIHPSTTCR